MIVGELAVLSVTIAFYQRANAHELLNTLCFPNLHVLNVLYLQLGTLIRDHPGDFLQAYG